MSDIGYSENFRLTLSPLSANVRHMQETEQIATLAPSEAGRILGVSAKTVARWADSGILGPVAVTNGGQRRLDRDAVEAFAAERQA